ncbi:MAG: hypothetical protein IPN29_11450 [Saprospiraceae bacterium]|nr:hypothetical protein [Saprospiraceae bacterium]
MMKSLTFFCSAIISILFTISLSAQVTVTVTGAGNTTPNLSASYASLNAALTDLNAINAMSGPVVLTCAAGSETAPSSAGFTLGSATLNPLLSATNTITLTASGVVTLNAAVGVATPTSPVPDGIFKIVGADWVTVNGLTFTDGNATNPEAMEFGLALFKMDAGDGAQNNTIQNCTFNMQRDNFATGTSPMVEGSVCLLTINSTPAAATTVLTPSSAAGTNSNNKYYSNTTNGGNYGIVLSGYAAASPFTLGDTNNDIGGADISTSNIIRNYGGGTASTNPAAGIRANNQWGINISYNDVDNNDGGGVDHPSTLRGIYGQAGTSANATINFNTVSIKGGGTTSQLTGIEVAIGSTAASNTVDINNNTVQNSTYSTATSGTFRAIAISSSPAILNVTSNSILNNTSPSTGQFDCIILSSTPGTYNCNYNTIDGNIKTGTGTFHGIYYSSSGSAMVVTLRGNAVTNNQIQGASGLLYCMRGVTSLYTVRENTISANKIPNTSGTTTSSIYGWSNAGSPTMEEIFENDIFDLSIDGAGTSTSSLIYGINLSTSSSSNKNIYNNRIRNLQYINSSTGAATIIGISQSLALSANIYSNTIYDLLATNGTASLVRGIQISSGTTLNVYNNLIGNLQASASDSGDALRGINITSASTSSNLNISYNTIYLNGTSSGTNFGSQGLYHTYSTTATTAVLNMRNNIISNLSTANGTGLTVAFRRSASTNLNNYGAVSNNNLFYAGTPSATNLIFTDGTNNDQTLAAFKARVTPRETVSISESPNFVSTTGSDPTFLHVDTGIGTQIESGGINIAGITSDFDGDVRNGATPDIGADEFSSIGIDLNPPVISYALLSNSSCIENKNLTPVNITDASGVNIAAGTRPRMYYKKSTNANTVNDNTNATDGWKYVEASGMGDTPFSFTTDFSLLLGGAGAATGDTIQYFVVAQDIAATPNVGINAGSFATTPASVALTAAHFPIGGTLNKFIFVPAGLSGAKTIGAAGDYPTLTGVGGLFEAINAGGMSAALTATIIDASVTETGATALNGINYNGCVAGPYALTIKPSATSVLTGSVGAGALIKLNGADNVTIDGSNSGGNDRSLTIQNTTATTSGNAVVWLAAPAIGNGSTDNTVKNCIIEGNSSTTSLMGVYVGGNTTISTTAAGNESNNNNTFQNNLFRKTQYGLVLFGFNANSPDQNNLIANNNFGTAVAGEGFGLAGIWADRQQNLQVSGNEVQNVTGTSTSTQYGIRLLDFKNGLAFNNNVHDLSYTGTSTGKVYGIVVISSTYTTMANPSNATVYNNFISKLNASSTSAVWNVTGLFAGAGYGDKFYHNTVHLTGQVANTASAKVAAFANGDGNISAFGTSIDVRNNIFNVEGSNSASGGNFWAFYSRATSLAGSTINYNDLNCVGTNATNNTGSFNSINYVTLADWQAASGMDANSFTETPIFTSSSDLHLNLGMTSTRLESGGTNVAIATDIDLQSRPGPAGSVNGGASNPDVGADEFDGVPALPMMYVSSTVDQVSGSAYAGAINQSIIRIKVVTSGPLTPISATSFDLNANGTTDIADINTANAKIYYTGSSTAFSTGTLFGSAIPTFATFTITGSQILNNGDNYFWLAYDVTTGAASSNLIDGECTSVTVGSAFMPTVTAPSGNKQIVGPMNGTYLVGAAETFPNFQTLTNAIADLNNRGVSGPVIIELKDALYSSGETFPLILNQVAGASGTNTILFKPGTGVTSLISGSTSSGALIKLNGADYVVIDGSNSGGTDRSLTITNTATAGSTVVSVVSLGGGAGATNNTIKNCNLSTGIATTIGYVISVGGNTPGTGGDDNDNTTLQNNSISLAPIGIYATGTVAGTNDNLNIIGNTITYNGTLASLGIQAGHAVNSLISQNTIDEQTTASQSPTGISLETGFINSSVTKNNVTKALTTATGGYGGRGITVGTASATSNLTIANNFISGINGSNWTGFSNSSSMGIGIGMIGNSSTITTVAGGINIYHNSINLYGNYQGTSTTANKITAALYVGTGATALDVRNNVFVNSMVNASAVASAYAIYSAAPNTSFTTIDFNDYFVSGTQGVLAYIGSNRTDLAGIIAGFGQNASSVNADPKYVSNSDLHINTSLATIVESNGTPIAGVTTDIDNDARNVTTPDLGADEGNFIELVDNDIQTTAFIDPVSGGTKPVGLGFTPMASFTNQGINAQTNIPVRFRILNASMVEIYNQTGSIASLASGASFTHSFPSATLPSAGNYTMYASAELVGDQTPSNDEISGSLFGDVPLCGTYAVGASQPVGYQNLTQAFGKVNTLGVSCAVVFELQADYSSVGETLPLTLTNIPGISAVNTFTLKPASGVTSNISGSINANVILKILSDYVIIDGSNNGSTSRDLNLLNTSVTTPGVVLIGSIGMTPRTNVTLKNCNITNGINTSTAVGVTDGTVLGNDGYFNNITVQNNLIKKAYIGIYSRAAVSAGNGMGLTISNNDLTASGDDAIAYTGIYLQGIDGGLVSNNSVGNFNTSTNEDDKGIFLATGVKNTSILANKITNIGYTGTSGYGGHGIYVGTGTLTANILVANNMIANMYGDGWSYTGVPLDNPIGIVLTTTQTGISVFHNSINLSGNTLNQTDAMSMGIFLNTGGEADIRNNIIVNNLGLSGATGYGSAGIYAATSNAQFTDINYNDYVVTATGSGLKFLGQIAAVGSATLAAWQTATAKDANSVNINPVFTSATDLHLIPASNGSLNDLGTPIAGVTIDIDGDARSGSTPDLGADEFSVCSSVVTNSGNSGVGTLRYILGCIADGSTITYNQPTVITTTLTDQLIIDKNITIMGLNSGSRPEITVDFNTLGMNPGIIILAGKTVVLKDVDVKAINNGANNSLIDNFGVLNVTGASNISKI